MDIPLDIWEIIYEMYHDLTSRIKWKGKYSTSFPIRQGVRQGGILPTHFYKAYIEDLLIQLEESNVGLHLGTNYFGCPTCADDILLLSSSDEDMQVMLNTVNTYSKEHQYTIHPTKSVLLKQNQTSSNSGKESLSAWELGDMKITTTDQATHLGLTRSSKNENMINVDERISLARRTSYSLMKTGVHGTNGLNPRVSYNIYRIYILPRLLYILEILPLNARQLKALSDFHSTFLRNIQSLPVRTASVAIYALLGALPLEAELHKRQLSLLHSILTSENQNLKEILIRQYRLQVNQGTFLERTESILNKYNLPTIEELWENTPTKINWKYTTRSAIIM
ncbi:Hypothetical predicted protein [Mytilus galloprovincialis]|uniref:Reverse transcriptase domain-containing protein n=1 Tax=Mytilus galloprovincialis TaxID=29158 RepID=A0A8B6GER0_MYTGA|nr:Hypothetical predicted protein [Mytilus galloprovincialis]